jgi:hypothetical protein
MPGPNMARPDPLIYQASILPPAPHSIHLLEKGFAMTEKTTAPADTPDPFDPARLRLGQNFAATVGVKKLLTQVPVRKPTRQEFVRVHHNPDWHLATMILELKEDREVYLVAPELYAELLGEIVPVMLYPTINRQGIISLWPCKLPGPDGKTNPWHKSALEAAEHAIERWVRIAANMMLGAYEIFEAAGDLPEPKWPDLSLQELLKLAFKDTRIDRPDHPVVQRLRGAV